MREDKYKLSRKITQLKSDIAPQDSINAMESSQSDTLPSIHFQLKSSEITHILQTLESLPQALSPKPERLKANLDSLFKNIFECFDGLIKEKNAEIKTLFMTHFEQIAMQKKQEIEKEIKNKQESLESALATKNNGDAEAQKDRIQSKQSQIQEIAKQITHTLEELS